MKHLADAALSIYSVAVRCVDDSVCVVEVTAASKSDVRGAAFAAVRARGTSEPREVTTTTFLRRRPGALPKAINWRDFNACEECGVSAHQACRTQDDDVAEGPCDGRPLTPRGVVDVVFTDNEQTVSSEAVSGDTATKPTETATMTTTTATTPTKNYVSKRDVIFDFLDAHGDDLNMEQLALQTGTSWVTAQKWTKQWREERGIGCTCTDAQKKDGFVAADCSVHAPRLPLDDTATAPSAVPTKEAAAAAHAAVDALMASKGRAKLTIKVGEEEEVDAGDVDDDAVVNVVVNDREATVTVSAREHELLEIISDQAAELSRLRRIIANH